MNRGTATRIEERWDRRDVGEGQRGLAKLGDTEFSGAVEAGGAWLFMLNGRIVGSSGGSEESIGANEPLTVHTAPHPSLPLLFAMQDRGGDTEARYFTDDTPLSEVHETLSSGSFTGYIELSENVHSGDYYVVYYGGRALYVAFVGNSDRLVTGEEAFERANDEVGIYEVISVDLDVRDVPDVDPGGVGGVAASGSGESDPSDTGAVTGAAPDDAGDGDGSVDAGDGVESDIGSGDEPEVGSGADPEETPPDIDEASPTAEEESPTVEGSSEPASGGSAHGVDEGAGSEPGPPDPDPAADQGRSDPDSTTADARPSGQSRDAVAGSTGQAGSGSADASRFSDEAAWREQQTVPALDPEQSGRPDDAAEHTSDAGEETEPTRDEVPAESETAPERDPRPAADADRIEELEAEIESLRDRVASLSEDREELAAERDRLVEERDRLQARVRDLEASEGTAGSGTDLTAEEALAQTDLLVRYGSKSDATLADAHDGNASPETLGSNLRLKTHTRFDADATTVDGEAFESFLRDTLAYRFVRWLTEDLLFEIRETGNRNELRDLYDALPGIDRAEFDGTVSVRDDDGVERTLSFDVVVRDQMGQPLFVADIDGDRDPTRGELMEGLLDRSTVVVEAMGSLSAAFLVTASFFHNEVHEQVREATRTGLLDRDSRASFVKAARNGGYHVCLVEAHDEEFHVSRPDL